ncbi:hypothetical protein [Pseudacidovorax intermedius]|uniref:hypothetical protein n=1 Tax=Pseudacidovorax intermedius TaxID=433924 RepID=UPI0026F2691A|nr:hypothetical protein [Pseudacidovorax intermedius]
MPALPIRPTVLVLSLACAAASVLAAEPAAEPLAATQAPADVAAPQVRTATGAAIADLNLDLAQSTGRSYAVQSQRVFGTAVDIGVPSATTAAGPAFQRPHARSSATFEPATTTGGLGLANVAWLGLQRLGSRAD